MVPTFTWHLTLFTGNAGVFVLWGLTEWVLTAGVFLKAVWSLSLFTFQIFFLFNSKVEDAFYKGELRLNGEKLWKKSRTVSHPACNDSHMVLPVALLVSAVPNSPLGPGALSEGFHPGHAGGNCLWATISPQSS